MSNSTPPSVLENLVARVERMVRESGSPEGFDAAAWLDQWLQQPAPALGGKKPLELLSTEEGQREVEAILARTQTGAYS